MARSSYIYLIQGNGNVGSHDPIASFTVKHELVKWLKKYYGNGVGLNGIQGWRMPDGDPEFLPNTWIKTKLDLEELMK